MSTADAVAATRRAAEFAARAHAAHRAVESCMRVEEQEDLRLRLRSQLGSRSNRRSNCGRQRRCQDRTGVVA